MLEEIEELERIVSALKAKCRAAGLEAMQERGGDLSEAEHLAARAARRRTRLLHHALPMLNAAITEATLMPGRSSRKRLLRLFAIYQSILSSFMDVEREEQRSLARPHVWRH